MEATHLNHALLVVSDGPRRVPDMPETNDQVEDNEVDEHTPLDQVRAAHRRATARAAELETQLGDLPRIQRENAALRAGIDIESNIGQLFVNSYSGETTPDAMKTAWDALGVTPAAPPQSSTEPPTGESGTEPPTPEELDMQRRRGAVGAQSTPPGGEPGKSLVDEMYEVFHENMRSGMDRKRAGAGALQLLVEAAANPSDPRHDQAVFDPERWAREHVQ